MIEQEWGSGPSYPVGLKQELGEKLLLTQGVLGAGVTPPTVPGGPVGGCSPLRSLISSLLPLPLLEGSALWKNPHFSKTHIQAYMLTWVSKKSLSADPGDALRDEEVVGSEEVLD